MAKRKKEVEKEHRLCKKYKLTERFIKHIILTSIW